MLFNFFLAYVIYIRAHFRPTRNEKAHAIVTQLIDPVRYDPRMQAQSGADCEHSTCDESPVHVKVNTFVRQMRFDQAQMVSFSVYRSYQPGTYA